MVLSLRPEGSRSFDVAQELISNHMPKGQETPAADATLADFACTRGFMVAACGCGETHVKVLLCGHEWCVVCGAEGSAVHDRRFSRWWERVKTMKRVGYWVFTVPMELRDRFRSGEQLRKATAYVMAVMKELGFDHGRDRWHWSGEKNPSLWHPHLNVFTESGSIPKDTLKQAKIAWAAFLGVGDYRKVDVHYKFVDPERLGSLKRETLAEFGYEVGDKIPADEFRRIWKEVCLRRVVHLVKYVTRGTFPQVIGFERAALIRLLVGYRNDHWWGPNKWGTEEVWTLEGGENAAVHALANGRCPNCGEPVRWQKVRPGALAGKRLVPLGGGYFKVVDEVDPVREYVLDVLREQREKSG